MSGATDGWGTKVVSEREIANERNQLRAATDKLSQRCGFPIVEDRVQALNAVGNAVERLRAHRDEQVQAAALLDDAWDPERVEYDTQGVNQAHRLLRGGDPPRATKPHPVDEGAP